MVVVVVKTRTWFLVAELWQSSLFTATNAKTKQRVLKTLAHRGGTFTGFVTICSSSCC
jgi:hypothetical protein